jgi:hypothetical protein
MAAMILSRQVEFRGLVDHRTGAGKTIRRGTPSRLMSRVARVSRSA